MANAFRGRVLPTVVVSMIVILSFLGVLWLLQTGPSHEHRDVATADVSDDATPAQLLGSPRTDTDRQDPASDASPSPDKGSSLGRGASQGSGTSPDRGSSLDGGPSRDSGPSQESGASQDRGPSPDKSGPRLVGRYNPSFRPPPDLYMFRGQVSDSVTGAPLPRVHIDVVVQGGGTIGSTTTDEHGRYEVKRSLPKHPAQVRVRASHFEYRNPQDRKLRKQDLERGLRTVDAGANRVTVCDIELIKRGTAEGYVVGPDGEAVSNATVSLIEEVDGALATVESDMTSDEGFFYLRQLMPVGHRDGATAHLKVTSPGHLEARVLEVYAMSENQLRTLRVEMSSGFNVRGTLYHGDGTLARETWIFGQCNNHAFPPVRTSVKGTFEFKGGVAGELIVSAFHAGTRGYVRRRLVVRGDVEGLSLHLGPAPQGLLGPTTSFAGITLAPINPTASESLQVPGFDQGLLVLRVDRTLAQIPLGNQLREGDVISGTWEIKFASARHFVATLSKMQAGLKRERHRHVSVSISWAGTMIGASVTPRDCQAAIQWLEDNPE